MDEEGREISRDSVSRRSVLKGMGAGAAIAWSAPVLQSLAAPAHAQYGGCAAPCSSCFDGSGTCGNSGPFGICFCAESTEGQCFCGEEQFCSGVDECAASSDCGPGETCLAVNCQGCIGHQCFVPCGTNPGARRATGNAKRASQR